MFRLSALFLAACSLCFCSLGNGRLVGLPAPDFEAEAVFEKKFIDVKLSDYRLAAAVSYTCHIVLLFYTKDGANIIIPSAGI